MTQNGDHPKDYSTIDEHSRRGKRLVPPLINVPGVTLYSWVNDRLPEMLWAALLFSELERETALGVFRRVAAYGPRFHNSGEHVEITHTGISRMPRERAVELLEILCSDNSVRAALEPLVVLVDLPGRDRWARVLPAEPKVEHWGNLRTAVGRSFWHQSQGATDCRWCRVLFIIASGRMVFPAEQKEIAKEVVYYPNYGDPRQARPTIRALEGALEASMSSEDGWTDSDWATSFWKQCLAETPCIGLVKTGPVTAPPPSTSRRRVNLVSRRLVEHCNSTRTTSAIDARHDAVFGLSVFSSWILRELLGRSVSSSLLGRMGLRSLFECYVTLSYLAEKDETDLWRAYRSYGVGQAKLAFMKLDDADKLPGYVDADALQALANEDYWQEFVSVDFGHWARSNLRLMSEETNLKEEYDRYYPWTSGFVHAHWGAVRDSMLETCVNPLHRFHRVPRARGARSLNNVLADACYLVDQTLRIVDRLYPDFRHRVSTDRVD